ncbi:MAG: DUF3999 family protein [Terracidiphilus sp.]|jgi:hypothetical protein
MKLSATFLLLAVAAASPEIQYFRYERPLQNLPQNGGQSCLVLDAGIFNYAAPQLADLRLYRDGTETPYVIRTAAAEQGAQKVISLLNLGVQDAGTVFDAELPEGKYSDLDLTVTGQDFIATVAVSGSRAQDGSAATKLGSYTIFDLKRQRLGRSTVLHLPESDFRYLHFRVAGPLRPDNFTGLSVERLPASQPKYETVAETSHSTQKGHDLIFEFTVPAQVPVDRIVFVPEAEPRLFSRDVSVSVAQISPPTMESDTAGPPVPVTSNGNLLRIHSMQNGRRIDEERLAIDAPREDFAKPAKWTVTIENGDDAPLKMDSVRLEMLERNLCFEAAVNTHYTLYYGDSVLQVPRYDYSELFTPQSDAAKISADAEQANPRYQPRPDERPFTEKHPWLLWAALIAVIALLGLIALRTAMRTGTTPKS